MVRFLSVIVAFLVLSGCGGAVITSRDNNHPLEPNDISYGLPRVMLPLTFKRTETRENPGNHTPPPNETPTPNVTQNNLRRLFGPDGQALPVAATVRGRGGEGTPAGEKEEKPSGGEGSVVKVGDLEVNVGAPIFMRDDEEENNFAIRQNHEWYTSDSVTIQTDGAGLLAAINATSENQVSSIGAQAIALAGQLAQLTAQWENADKEVPCEPKAFNVSLLVDPLNDTSIKELEERLNNAHACLDIRVEPQLDLPTEKDPDPVKPGEWNGVFYRLARPYQLQVTDRVTHVTHPFIFSAPDDTKKYFVRLERDWFVKFDAKLTFDHGVLTKFEATRPSEALAALQLPSDIVKAILGLDSPPSSGGGKGK